MIDGPDHLVIDDPLDVLATQADAGSAIDAWLGVFTRLMHLPESVRSEIRAELREHLRERVRDLLLSAGCAGDERTAVRTAIEELGETAHLAHRFEQANRPNRRRLLMNLTLAVAGVGAIAAGVIAFNPNHGALPVTRFAPVGETSQAAAPPKSFTQGRITLKGDNALNEILAQVAEIGQLNLLVNWRELEDAGVTRDAPVQVALRDVPITQALDLVTASVSDRANPLDWRAHDGLIEFGIKHNLDAREVELLSYDVARTVNLIANNFNTSTKDAAEQICDLLTSLVEPINWIDNGGDLAQMRLVGGRLFVQAPTRMQTKVAWILDQLPKDDAPQVNAAGGVEPVPVLSDIPLLSQVFASRGDSPSALKAMNDAEAEFKQIKEHFQPGTPVYDSAEKRCQDAKAAYEQIARRAAGGAGAPSR